MSCIRQRPRQMDIRKGVVSLATGAGAVYLLYKAIKAGIKCQPPFCSASPICIARLAIERERHGRDSGELRRLLNSLECKQDAYTKSMILHSITRCVYLLESEASGCTNDDVTLVGSMLDDKDNSVKIQALNTLKAFSGIRKFRLKIQEVQVRSLVGELRSHMPHTSEQGGKKIQLRSRQMEEMEEQNVGEGLPRLLQACHPPSPSVYSPTQGSPNPVM